MNANTELKIRYDWIDYAKVIGILLIIWGHFFPPHLSKYIYSINVPIFFFLSGYLYKNTSFREQLRKNIKTLAIPYFLLATINFSITFILGRFHIDGYHQIGHIGILSFIKGTLLGFHSYGYVTAAGTLWFVYDLFFVKTIANIVSKKRSYQITAFIIAFISSLSIDIFFDDAISMPLTSIPIAYLFFEIGRYTHTKSFNFKWPQKKLSRILLFIILGIIYFIFARRNNVALLFCGQLGKNPLYFFISTLIGMYIMFSVLQIIKLQTNSFIKQSSNGTIITLAFHCFFIDLILRNMHIASNYPLWSFILSVIILCFCYLIIIFVKKHIPILMGGRK